MAKGKSVEGTERLSAKAKLGPDLISATLAELEEWSVLGPDLAKKLVTARPFEILDDLRRVPGFTAGVMAACELGARLEPMGTCA